MKILILGAILLLTTAGAFAQSTSPVAMIDSSRFTERGGVERMANAWGVILSFDPCHHRCGRMEDDIKTLEKEIADLKCAKQPLGDHESRLQKLKSEYDQVRAFAKERAAKNYDLFMKPVVDDVREFAKKFAAERGYIVLVNKLSIMDFDSPVLASNENVPDVTTEFIAFCNAEFERRRANQGK